MIRWISFQSLIGGMMLGAEKAFDCKPICQIDYEGVSNSDLYLKYQKNVKNVEIPHFILDGNIISKSMKFKNEIDESLLKGIDVVCGVPICSGLSPANTVSDRSNQNCCGSDAIQNNNMIGMLQFTLEVIKPKVYIFENAYKLATNLGKDLREKLFDISRSYGYSSTVVKVNTINHNSPQNRTRTFYVTCKGSNCPKFFLSKTSQPTIMSIIGDLKNQKGVDITDNPWYKFAVNYLGKDWRHKLEEKHVGAVDDILISQEVFDIAKKFFVTDKEKYQINRIEKKFQAGKHWMADSIAYSGDRKISTLYGRSLERLVHPVEDRIYSSREYMRLMGMPDDFEIPKNINMICQNVPVMTAEYYCSQIKQFLDGKLQNTNELVQNLSK